MKFKELSKQEISDFIMNDPGLIYMGFTDKELIYMYEQNKYECRHGSQYIGIETNEGILIGILRWEYFTDQTICVHPYISTKYQGKGLAKEMSKFVTKHLEDNTEIIKVVAIIGEPCFEAIRAVEACGFKKEGHVTNCIMWRNKKTGMFFYGLDLNNKRFEDN